ncbi:uncharacterized protein LOC122247473 isoform X2 [Penaeus japonicus]|uniref:uncharacterized protein LOC122247473 isoform X2 n=1 Tax=Penaeus japonicus TaxID=27405 RepID=UPI001C7176C0|nr:uncharacterized protein LOC122247473 isoform X2 [Penaeus japonicus]
MKLLMLLALAGLASCSTRLVGGDRARDVSLRYKYFDDNGKEIQVEIEAERLGLGLVGGAPRTAVASAPAPAPAPARAPAVRLAPVRAVPYSAPRAAVRTRYVPAQVVPVRRVETRFVSEQVVPVPQPQLRTVAVEVAPTPQVTHYIPVEAPRTRLVDLDDDDDDDVSVVFAPRVSAPRVSAPVQRLAPLRHSLAALDKDTVIPARRISDTSDEK